MVFMCLSLSVFSTIEEYEARAGIVLFYMETVVVIWFAIEFFLRYMFFVNLSLLITLPFVLVSIQGIFAGDILEDIHVI